MIKRPRINDLSQDLGNKILCFLHYQYAHSENVVFTKTEISDCIECANQRHIDLALESLIDGNYVDFESGDSKNPTETGFFITRTGIYVVDQWNDEEYALYSEGVDFLEEYDQQQSPTIPASDRIVTLTDNQCTETVNALEDFIKEFRQDHHFGNEWVAEKSALLKTLEAGKDYIENKVIEVRVGTMMTIEPLKEIVSKYDQVAVGGIVSAMAQKLIELLINLFAG